MMNNDEYGLYVAKYGLYVANNIEKTIKFIIIINGSDYKIVDNKLIIEDEVISEENDVILSPNEFAIKVLLE